jgi:hypothetical protein
MIELLRGNSIGLIFALKIDGGILDTLAQVSKAVFMAKLSKDYSNSDASINIVSLRGDTSPQIVLDSPVEGSVTVNLKGSDVDIDPDIYFFALQLEWDNGDVLEFSVGDGKIQIIQDVIQC